MPESAPPFDDEPSEPAPPTGAEPFAAEPFAADPFRGEPRGAESPGSAPPDESAGPDDGPGPDRGPGSEDGRGPDRGPGPGGTGGPGQDRWPGQFAQVLAETLAGSRPPGQIRPWTTEQARRRIRQLGPLLAAGQRPRLRRIIAFSPAAGVVEMTVVAAFGPRVRALAVRLERDSAMPPRPAMAGRAQWRCTTVEAA